MMGAACHIPNCRQTIQNQNKIDGTPREPINQECTTSRVPLMEELVEIEHSPARNRRHIGNNCN
jgi:hypothetical protein